jgi:hypothetical protein
LLIINVNDKPFRQELLEMILGTENPSSIYSWSIGHILEHEFFCLGHLGCAGSKAKKVDLRNYEQLFRVVFSTFGGQKKYLKFF